MDGFLTKQRFILFSQKSASRNTAHLLGFMLHRDLSILKNICIQKITFLFILLCENDILCIFRAFFKSMIFDWKIFYLSDFELKFLLRYVLDFELKKIQRVVFWFE